MSWLCHDVSRRQYPESYTYKLHNLHTMLVLVMLYFEAQNENKLPIISGDSKLKYCIDGAKFGTHTAGLSLQIAIKMHSNQI